MYRDVYRKLTKTGSYTVDYRDAGTCYHYLCPYDKMLQLAKQNWEINMFYRKILEYSLIVSQTKADSWRFESARERYNLLLETHPEIIKRAPLADIASYLLMTPETLSRVRSGVL